METVEQTGTVESEKLTYDGFISYSHAADDLLAPRLQAGLQRFAILSSLVRFFQDGPGSAGMLLSEVEEVWVALEAGQSS